jgi:hypothetical protein
VRQYRRSLSPPRRRQPVCGRLGSIQTLPGACA